MVEKQLTSLDLSFFFKSICDGMLRSLVSLFIIQVSNDVNYTTSNYVMPDQYSFATCDSIM